MASTAFCTKSSTVSVTLTRVMTNVEWAAVQPDFRERLHISRRLIMVPQPPLGQVPQAVQIGHGFVLSQNA